MADWKSKLRAKAAAINRKRSQTGGGGPSLPPLNGNEKRLLQLIGNASVYGHSQQELGAPVGNTITEDHSILPLEVTMPEEQRPTKPMGNSRSEASGIKIKVSPSLLPPPLTPLIGETEVSETPRKRSRVDNSGNGGSRNSTWDSMQLMHQETLEVLRCISDNIARLSETTGRLADSHEKLVNFLENKFK
ncbi:uncharacterized protein LOC123308204 isoform X1 [Coccinella septempunctata]|uniref:uncharacterized protein LOC123308204 isoform X1 n=1 Tax=Coccinella septempunctata TaxID=41139 RepID=UPI001D06FE1C|nr:uncharacterized protein LOC123308204 isoform X1 [Coccinella septempunctata]